jgi:peptidoglycan/LPS O-acetylase OafA/YrhL
MSSDENGARGDHPDSSGFWLICMIAVISIALAAVVWRVCYTPQIRQWFTRIGGPTGIEQVGNWKLCIFKSRT